MPVLTRPDGVRLYYELHGPDDAPPLILLEGMGGDIPGWRRNIPELASELRVIAHDLRGNGNGDEPPGPATMGTFVDDTLALLDELGIERAHVYGQSFGGMVAQEMALTKLERLRTLILGGTYAGPRHAVRAKDSTVP
jgi:3-oxoadipate enol-lactonase